jgi:hypothetical protein
MSEQQFEPEIKKFKWLLTEGYITPQELGFYSNFYEIQMTSIVNFEGYEVLAPLIIIARPSKFDSIKKQLQAEIADPIAKKFPLISLISIEKFINSLVTMKIPFFFFTLWLHRSYSDAPPQVHGLLHTLIDLANTSNKYVIKYYNIKEEPLPVSSDLQKIVCHFKKMLGDNSNCDDSDWWRYNLWGKTTSTAVDRVDRKLIEKLALQYNISPICVQYVILYNKNPCHLSSDTVKKISSDTVKKIKSHLSS